MLAASALNSPVLAPTSRTRCGFAASSVLAPLRRGALRHGAARALAQIGQRTLQHVGRYLGFKHPCRTGLLRHAGTLPAIEQRGQSDRPERLARKPVAPAKRGVAVGRLVPVALEETERERPAEHPVHQQGKQEGTHILAVRQPDGGVLVAPLEGEDIDEDGPCAREQHVQRGRILENPSVGQRTFAQVEGQFGCGQPLRLCPLPRIAGNGNPRMPQAEFAAGVVDVDAGFDVVAGFDLRLDQVSALLQFAAERGLQQIEHGGTRRRAHPADDQAVFKAERTRGIAKGSAGRRSGHATSRESPVLGATGRTAAGVSFLRLKKARIRRRTT
jgi:hypothetical protein